MNGIDIILTIAIITGISISTYYLRKPQIQGIDINLGTPQKTRIRSKTIGGEQEIHKIRRINDDKGLITFKNGTSQIIYYKDLIPESKLQCLTGINPVWVMKNAEEKSTSANGKERPSKFTREFDRESLQREKSYERARSIEYENNIEYYIDKRVSTIRDIIKSNTKPEGRTPPN